MDEGIFYFFTNDGLGCVCCDRGPIPFKCIVKPRISNVKETLLAALQD